MITPTKTVPRDRLRFLEHEVARYRSLFISLVGEDAEGAYRPELVARVLKTASERPTKIFRGASHFFADPKRT